MKVKVKRAFKDLPETGEKAKHLRTMNKPHIHLLHLRQINMYMET